ncbi:MAG: glycosyltransferase [Calditrichia bacterium]
MIKNNTLISLCMIVKNEATNLPRCLGSVKNLVDEMIVVDTGSSDGTQDIAKNAGAKLFTEPWQDDFSAAKNAAISRANGQWILVLDADEELLNPDEIAQPLRQQLNETNADAFRLPVRNRMPAGDLMQIQEFYLTRLFRNRPEFRYEGRIHEQIRPAIERNGGNIETADVTILHHGYAQTDVQGGQNRLQRNIQLLESVVKSDPLNAYLNYHLGSSYKDTGDFQSAEKHLQISLENGNALPSEIREKLFAKLSQIALAKNDYRSAAAFAGECLAISPDNLIGLYSGSLALIYTGNFADALDGFQAIAGHPNANPAELPQIQQIIQFCQQKLGSATYSHT